MTKPYRIKEGTDPERDMIDAEIILFLIEHVDPADIDKLDEIDARVSCLVADVEYERHNRGEMTNILIAFFKVDDPTNNFSCLGTILTYTRSRDALKTIRPEGWQAQITSEYRDESGSYTTYNIWEAGKEHQIDTPTLSNEYLSELHAIIQAIEYERIT